MKKTATETGKTVVYGYTADGQLGSVDMGSLAYDYLYDSLGRLITSSRHDSNTLKLQTRHEYDTSNRLTKQYLNLVDKTYSAQYNYDSYGRLSQVEQSNGTWDSKTTYTYDNLSRLKTVTTPVYKITYTYVSGTTQIAGIKYSAVNAATATAERIQTRWAMRTRAPTQIHRWYIPVLGAERPIRTMITATAARLHLPPVRLAVILPILAPAVTVM